MAIDEFIVSNGFTPIKLNDLRIEETAQYAQSEKLTENKLPAEVARLCGSDSSTGNLINYVKTMSRNECQKTVADLLSISWWPVLDPCM